VGLDSKRNDGRFLWEWRPVIYLFLGFGSIVFSRGSWILIASGVLFLVAGVWVFQMRKEYRKSWGGKPPGQM
jgi:hypothetical protein